MPKPIVDISAIFRATLPEKKPTDATISYSQFSMYQQCQLKWKLNYIDKIRFGGPSIITTFGTAFHETLQYYLYVLYHKTAKEADQINLSDLLQERLTEVYEIEMHTNNNGEHFTDAKTMQEFYMDGVEILTYLQKNRTTYFKVLGWELLGVELPLYIQASESNSNVFMNGFIDVVLRDTKNDEIHILDIKTSTRGWTQYDKANKLKTSQLVLYKQYFAKQYGYDVEKIHINYFIVKRKLLAESMFPQRRIQEFQPSSGKVTRKNLQKDIDSFVSACFNADGTKNTNREYTAFADKGGKNCKYCDFADKFNLCPKENRIKAL
jgi:Zn/Cd-binding protein ZinT